MTKKKLIELAERSAKTFTCFDSQKERDGYIKALKKFYPKIYKNVWGYKPLTEVFKAITLEANTI